MDFGSIGHILLICLLIVAGIIGFCTLCSWLIIIFYEIIMLVFIVIPLIILSIFTSIYYKFYEFLLLLKSKFNPQNPLP